MTDIYRKPSSGEDFVPSARQFHSFIEAAQAHAAGGGSLSALAQYGKGIRVNVLNDTGTDCPWFGVLTVDDVVVRPDVSLSEFLGNATLKSTAVNADAPPQRIVIAQQPIPKGTVGPCLIFGVSPCKLQMDAARDYDRAGVLNGETGKLQAGGSDGVATVSVVWNPQQTGDHYGLVKLEAGPDFAFLEVKQHLEECGDPVEAWLVTPSGAAGAPYWERSTVDPTQTVTPQFGWHGFGWGADATGRGEIVYCVRLGDVWGAVGSGIRVLFAIAAEDIAQGSTGSVTGAFIGAPDCDTGTAARGFDDVYAVDDISDGKQVIMVWNNQRWEAHPLASACVGCGITEDQDGCLIVDNTVVAGSNLEPDGECSIKLADSIVQRIAALELCCDTLTNIVNQLIECCEDSRECCEEAMQCCYEHEEAIDYIEDYCCGDGGIPGANDCSTQCLWEWNGTDWVNLVPCAGPAACDCQKPTHTGTQPGDLAFTDCEDTSGGGGGPGVDFCGCEGIPQQLTATFACTDCPCGDAANVPLTHNGSGQWKGTGDFCGETVTITLTCDPGGPGGDWQIEYDFTGACDLGATHTDRANHDSCDPFTITSTVDPPNAAGCCAAPFPTCTVTISE